MGGLVVASNNELQLPVECREWDNEGSDFEYTLNLYMERGHPIEKCILNDNYG